ncbi:MAG: hypothetical protein C4541_13175 [Candidatus Auribacter fodinae]|uniref:Uncharacterized protein n=1 Tax=Candidatus Auribacter fodinae TaxID=2093366 RepID=A0A3A4QTH2_9BACT|nr:MAG: hypothetical protein C4541_13175 [Candidatus Auribacter fodinae]
MYKWLFVVISMVNLCVMNNASATIMIRRFSTREMADFSDSIVHGTVKNIDYVRTEQKQVFTFITIECSNTYKGTHTQDVTIIQEGGVTEKYTTAVYGAPVYEKEEEVVVFLKSLTDTDSLNRVVALSQGKYSVVDDPQTGTKKAVCDLREIHFMDESGHHHGLIELPLETLINDIKDSLSESDNETAGKAAVTIMETESFDWRNWLIQLIIKYANDGAKAYYTYVKK